MAETIPPVTDIRLPEWSLNMAKKLQATPTLWGVTGDAADNYALLQSDYVSGLAACRDTDTMGPKATKIKDARKAVLLERSKEMIRVIRGQLGLSDEQLWSIGVPTRKSPTPVPRPSAAPGMSIVGVSGRTIGVQVRDADVGNKRGKPSGCTSIFAYYFVGATPPNDVLQWTFAMSTTKTKFDVVVPDAVAGGAGVWVCCAWANAKQDIGPVCSPQLTHVQGGGVLPIMGKMKIAA